MKHPSTTRRWRIFGLLAIIGVLALASCSDNSDSDDVSSGGSGDGDSTPAETIRISGQDFPEQRTLAQVYGQFLEANGYDVDIQDPIGTRTQIYAAFDNGTLDLALDYSGSAVVELGGEAAPDEDETYASLTDLLAEVDLEASAQASAANANALVALATWATDNGVTTISDLADVDGSLTLGGAPECAERPDCLLGYQDVYGLDLGFTAVDYGPPLVAALQQDEIQLAQYGSTAAELADGTIVVLEDDEGLQTAQNVVPVFRTAVSSPELIELLDELSALITSDDLAGWNLATDVELEDPADVATAWLEDNGLL